MKAVIMAGGRGSRLDPITRSVNKHLLPVYDKPMIFYSLSIALTAEVDKILIIINDQVDQSKFADLLGSGDRYGVSIEYLVQTQPRGIADGLKIARDFIKDDSVLLILGDNLLFGHGLKKNLLQAKHNAKKSLATIFGFPVSNPKDYGVAKMQNQQLVEIIEKPSIPPSNLAIPGVYFYPNIVLDIAQNIKPSARGELEITDVNNQLIHYQKLKIVDLGRGYNWLDLGSCSNLLEASIFIRNIQERQGNFIACLEEIAFNQKWITKNELKESIETLPESGYKNYLLKLTNHNLPEIN
jgi:glucose-1-phosphate thymidylyltransferase